MKLFSLKELLLLSAGLSVLCWLVFRYTDPAHNPYGLGSDTYEFWHLSSNIRELKEFAYTDLHHYPLMDLSGLVPPEFLDRKVSCTARVPGYPVILAVLRAVWNSPWVGILFNLACYVGICLYGFLIGRMFIAASRARWIYNVLLVFSPVYFTRWGLGADLPASLFATAFLFYLLRYANRSQYSWTDVFWACVCGILGSLTRANLFLFFGLLVFLVLNWGWKQKHLVRQTAVIFIALTLGTGLWMYRNKNLTGDWALSTQGGFVLFTVHKAYDISPDDLQYHWTQTGKQEYLLRQLREGKTFNQAEAELDRTLKAIVWNDYRRVPATLFAKWSDTLRTLFMFSYFDISDVLITATHNWPDRLELVDGSVSNIQFTPAENITRDILFQISRFYKIFLFTGFLGCLFFLLKSYDLTMVVYVAVLCGVLVTAFFTGAAGDRLRMPFNVPILIFCVLAWIKLLSLKTRRR